MQSLPASSGDLYERVPLHSKYRQRGHPNEQECRCHLHHAVVSTLRRGWAALNSAAVSSSLLKFVVD
eukprot:8428866-Karenia_brevis.AAC.1